MNITGWSKSWYEYYRVMKNLVWILQGEQKVGMNITGWSKSWYKNYRMINKLICIIRGDQKLVCKYYMVIKMLVWILQDEQRVGMNIIEWSKSWYEY
jgi:hypothetical protein